MLDESFQPSQQEAQLFLDGFCDDFFATDFAAPVSSDYACPITKFNQWLQMQAVADVPDVSYQENCGGAAFLPMDPSRFDACISAWAAQEKETTILSRRGKVEVMYIKFKSRVRPGDPHHQLHDEWHTIESYMRALETPVGARNGYFTSLDFWRYDSTSQMLRTAFFSAGVAMVAAPICILISSRSLPLTVFATISIGYVLSSVTATVVGLGWTLGFLESILFAILIGISGDFVVHFSHAYTQLAGPCDRSIRCKHTLLTMGPSILAAAFTTFSTAVCMLFTVIVVFKKFAVVLSLTVLHATIGTFVVFLVMADCLGPSEPTRFVDQVLSRCGNGMNVVREKVVDGWNSCRSWADGRPDGNCPGNERVLGE